jgi:hypothetical protein
MKWEKRQKGKNKGGKKESREETSLAFPAGRMGRSSG